MTQLVTITFHNQPIIAIEHQGKQFVAMKQIAENIGLDWQAQHARINRHAVLKTCVSMIEMQVAGDDQRRKLFCLPISMLNGWLMGVDVNRVRPELREKLTTYQRECFDVLYAHFNRTTLPNLYKQRPGDKLNGSQQQQLRGLLDEFVKTLPKEKQGPFMMQGWSKLRSHFGVAYRDIPAERFDEAVSLLTRHVVEHIKPAPAIAQPTAAAPSMHGRRWLLCFDRLGNEVATPVPNDAALLKYEELPDILAANDTMLSGSLLADIANACLQRLAKRQTTTSLAA